MPWRHSLLTFPTTLDGAASVSLVAPLARVGGNAFGMRETTRAPRPEGGRRAPHRRLVLTGNTERANTPRLVSGGGDLDPLTPAEAVFRLPAAVLDALEREWQRRQSAGEGWTPADIVQAALVDALASPERLAEALARLPAGSLASHLGEAS